MSQKICPGCRTANEGDAMFCGHCGARMDGAAAAFQSQPQFQNPPQFQSQPVQPSYSGYQTGGLVLPPGTVPAGFGIRLGAYLVDGVVLYAAQYLLQLTGLGTLVWPVSILYFVAFWALKGQTPGKMLFGLHVVATDGSPMSWGKAIIRYVGYMVSVITLGIGFIMIATDEAKRGLHDRIAKTTVVRKG